MKKIKEIMTRELITFTPQTEITQAAKLLLEKRINGAPVVDDEGRLVGILCQSDLVAQQKEIPLPSIFTFLDGFINLSSMKRLEKEVAKIAAATVAQAMTAEPVAISPEMSVEEAATLMVDRKFHTLPVVEEGKLVGIVGKEDVLRTLMKGSGEKEGEGVRADEP
ncbi:MAG: CBS domain-containing protein [Deltaproteobacteria bacterium]|nr:CBS domain-containing protein [Deltaproteobacteria bacterium]